VLGGTAAQDYIEQFGKGDIDLALFDGATDAMEATELALSNVDANLQDLPVWTFYSEGFPRLHAIGPPVGRGYYVALTRKADTDLLKAVNEAILKALQDGSLREILARYRMWNETQMARGLETNASGGFVGSAISGAEVSDKPADGATSSFEQSSGWRVIWQRGGLLISAAGMTVLLSVTAMPLAVAIGF